LGWCRCCAPRAARTRPRSAWYCRNSAFLLLLLLLLLTGPPRPRRGPTNKLRSPDESRGAFGKRAARALDQRAGIEQVCAAWCPRRETLAAYRGIWDRAAPRGRCNPFFVTHAHAQCKKMSKRKADEQNDRCAQLDMHLPAPAAGGSLRMALRVAASFLSAF